MNPNPYPVSLEIRPEIQQPLFTIAIPTYNRLNLLAEAVESALAQTGEVRYEVIVVDNGQDDAVRQWVEFRRQKSLNLGYYRNAENVGMVQNWNQCVHLSRGSWITLLHDDDLLGPSFLDEVSCHINNASVSVIACEVIISERLDRDWTRSRHYNKIYSGHLLLDNLSPFPGVLFRRSDCLRVGGFEVEYRFSSDYHFWLKLLRTGHGRKMASRQAFYRLSTVQQSFESYSEIISMSGKLRLIAAESLKIPSGLKAFFVSYGQMRLIEGYETLYRQSKPKRNCLSWRLLSLFWRILVFMNAKKLIV